MPSELEHYNELKRKSERLRKEADQAEGAEQQLNQQLLLEFNCKKLKEAEFLLFNLKEEQEMAEKEYQEAMDVFEAAWKEHLDQVS